MDKKERLAEDKLYEDAKNWMNQNGIYKTYVNSETGLTTVSFQKNGEESIESMSGDLVEKTISLYYNVR